MRKLNPKDLKPIKGYLKSLSKSFKGVLFAAYWDGKNWYLGCSSEDLYFKRNSKLSKLNKIFRLKNKTIKINFFFQSEKSLKNLIETSKWNKQKVKVLS